MKTNTAIVLSLAFIICACILGGAYKYKFKEQNTIVEGCLASRTTFLGSSQKSHGKTGEGIWVS